MCWASKLELTAHIGGWVAGFSATGAPAAARHEAGRCLIDIFGVSIAGSTLPSTELMRELALAQFGSGPCTILGSKSLGSSCAAALVNGTASHALDFDDVSYDGMVHSSAVVWPAAWAASEMVGASGFQTMEAFIAGVEVHCALGRAFTHELFWRGFWTTGLLGSMAAAATASKVFSLDQNATDAAIGIAMSQASGLRAIVGTPMKAVACGMATELGIRAALMARAGIYTRTNMASHSHGFAALFNQGKIKYSEIRGLGDYYTLEQKPMAFKLYPICSYGQAAVEALLEVRTALGAPVAQVLCEVPQAVLDNMPYGRPDDPTQAQFSLTFALAAALAFGTVAPEHLQATMLRDPHLTAAMDLLVIRAATAGMSARALADCQDGAMVTAYDESGRSVSRTVRVPTGTPQRPMTEEQLEAKFRDCIAPVIGNSAAGTLLRKIKYLDTMPNIRQLMNGLAATGPEHRIEGIQS